MIGFGSGSVVTGSFATRSVGGFGCTDTVLFGIAVDAIDGLPLVEAGDGVSVPSLVTTVSAADGNGC